MQKLGVITYIITYNKKLPLGSFLKKSVTNFKVVRITLQTGVFASAVVVRSAYGRRRGFYAARRFCGILRRYSSYDNNKA